MTARAALAVAALAAAACQVQGGPPLQVLTETAASDHQPVVLELDD